MDYSNALSYAKVLTLKFSITIVISEVYQFKSSFLIIVVYYVVYYSVVLLHSIL